MKQLLFAVLLILAMALNAGAKPEKNKGLVKDLVAAMKSSKTNSLVNAGSYNKLSFLYNNKTVSAFYDAESEDLIGFSIPLSLDDFAQDVVQKMENKFGKKYTFREAILFVKSNGSSDFYISMSRPEKPTIILSINRKGNPYYFGKE